MNAGQEKIIRDFIYGYFSAYSNRNKTVKKLYAKSFYGMDGINSVIYDYKNWLLAIDVDFRQIPKPFHIEIITFQLQKITKTKIGVYVIAGWDLPKWVRVLDADVIRSYFILSIKKNKIKIVHQSNSISFRFSDAQNEVYPEKYFKLQREKFNEKVERKTQEMEKLNHHLKKQSEELEMVNKELTQYAVIAAHDIKSPLVSISTVNDLLIDKYKHLIDASDKELMQSVNNRLENLTELISNLLKLYSTEYYPSYNAIEKAPLNVHEILEDIITDIRETKVKPFEINYSVFPTLYANRILIKQLFMNLTNNSIKYSRPKVPLKIDVSAKNLTNETVRFVFSDNGRGLNEVEKKGAFDLFSRFGQGNILGAGIGLTICKRIVKHYDGRIWIEITQRRNMAFQFTLKSKTKRSP